MDIESIKQDIERNRLLKGIILASLALTLIFIYGLYKGSGVLTTRFQRGYVIRRALHEGKHVRQHPHNRQGLKTYTGLPRWNLGCQTT